MLRQTNLPHVSGIRRWGTTDFRSWRGALACPLFPSRKVAGAGFGGAGASQRERHGSCHIAFAATGRTGSDLPRDWTEVVSWSRAEFRRCVSPALPDSALHLAKACLLVALEEEAARSGEAPHPELQELMAEASGSLRPRSAAGASTWSGERLEALAAEVAALLDQQLEESVQYRAAAAPPPPPLPPSAPDAADRAAEADAAAAAESRDLEASVLPSASAPAGSGAEGAAGAATGAAAASSSFDFAAEQEQLLDRIHTSRPGAVGSSSRTAFGSSTGSSRHGGKDRNGGSGGGGDGSEGGGDGDGSEGRYYGSAWPSGRRVYGRRQALYRRYPVQTLAAVNTVLFNRHGYQPCNRYGVPSDHQLAAVLERGVGASAALSILYLEVCDRLGFPLAARPLEDGRYFVLWPVDAPLTADGQRFLVDPYGRGGLLLLDEVCEIFGVEEASLRPASRRELLAALLGELRDAHWAAAAGCSPAPGSMAPLSVETALENKVVVPASGVRAASLRRALAAAEKRLWLLPDDGEAQLQYGLLLYFSRRYDDAWIELALYLERFAGCGGAAGGTPSAIAAPPQQQPPATPAPAAAAAMEGNSDPISNPNPNPSLTTMAARACADASGEVGAVGSGEQGQAPAPTTEAARHAGFGALGQTAATAGACSGGGAAVAAAEAREAPCGSGRHGGWEEAEAEEGLASSGCSRGSSVTSSGEVAEADTAESVDAGLPAAAAAAASSSPSSSSSSSSSPLSPDAPAAPAPAAPAAAATGNATASSAAQVAVLVERIRLVLDFAPAQ